MQKFNISVFSWKSFVNKKDITKIESNIIALIFTFYLLVYVAYGTYAWVGIAYSIEGSI